MKIDKKYRHKKRNAILRSFCLFLFRKLSFDHRLLSLSMRLISKCKPCFVHLR